MVQVNAANAARPCFRSSKAYQANSGRKAANPKSNQNFGVTLNCISAHPRVKVDNDKEKKCGIYQNQTDQSGGKKHDQIEKI